MYYVRALVTRVGYWTFTILDKCFFCHSVARPGMGYVVGRFKLTVEQQFVLLMEFFFFQYSIRINHFQNTSRFLARSIFPVRNNSWIDSNDERSSRTRFY